ncbi:MAG TPA: PBSX family phage terminase large subunit [Melioribacteraceae bacterium]|nr:PBSX family phage terminase large subunit [Melioribacteraceae bacterium]
MELTIKHTKVFTKSLEAYRNPKINIIVNQGGTRSSKTFSIAQLIIFLCHKNEGRVYSIVRKAFPSLRATVMRDFFDILKGLNEYSENNHNKTEHTYILNNNTVEFFSLDDEQKVRGRKRDILWINEANEIDEDSFLQLNFRTSGKIFLDYNPSISETHWIITNILERDDAHLIISTYRDNPFLGKKQILEIERLKLINPSMWAVFGEGVRSEIQTGTVFIKDFYQEYDVLPRDVKSVIYVDPNLSLKGQGDTTAITHLGYSGKTNMYYVIDAISQSFSDSNDLLNAVFLLKLPNTIGIAFDGNVTQESTWTNLVKNWSKQHDSPFYRIEYKRYKVDDLSKNIQLTWNEKRVLFPAGFRSTMNGKIYIGQLFAFTSKKAGNLDDAPDSLICAYEYLHERKIADRQIIMPFKQPKINLDNF